MGEQRVRFGIKVAQMTGTYDGIQDAWLEADRLGFDTSWGHDHLLNQNEWPGAPWCARSCGGGNTDLAEMWQSSGGRREGIEGVRTLKQDQILRSMRLFAEGVKLAFRDC